MQMLQALKYVLLVIVALVPSDMPKGLGWKELIAYLWKSLCTWRFLVALIGIEIVAIDDYQSGDASQTLSKNLIEAKSELKEARAHIGALVFNIDTSFEGKLRFLRCFRNLSDMSNIDCYAPLICDDGIAVFRFTKDEAMLSGFFFFSNAHVNEVLAGIPMDGNVYDGASNIVFSADSEIAKAMTQFKERKTPQWIEGNEVAQKQSLREILRLVKIFFRYVYRDTMVYVEGDASLPWCIGYSYEVDPFDDGTCRRSMAMWVPDYFVRSLHGITMEEFSTRLLTHYQGQGVSPKIRVRDIELLNKSTIEDAYRKSFPYGKRDGVKFLDKKWLLNQIKENKE